MFIVHVCEYEKFVCVYFCMHNKRQTTPEENRCEPRRMEDDHSRNVSRLKKSEARSKHVAKNTKPF